MNMISSRVKWLKCIIRLLQVSYLLKYSIAKLFQCMTFLFLESSHPKKTNPPLARLRLILFKVPRAFTLCARVLRSLEYSLLRSFKGTSATCQSFITNESIILYN